MTGQLIETFSTQIADYHIGFTQFLSAINFMTGPATEIVIAGDPEKGTAKEMIEIVRNKFLPNSIIVFHNVNSDEKRIVKISSFIKDMPSIDGNTTVYICEGPACKTPITDIEDLKLEVDKLLFK